jgi:iron complex transport system substrate-binding protein
MLLVKNTIERLFYVIMVFYITTACDDRPQPASNARRIISLSPNITEIIYALGAEKDLVAVSSFCNYPPAVKEKEKIGGLLDPNIEKIISLNPTMLLGVPAHQKLDQDLRRFNLQILMLPNESVIDIIHAIDTLGQILHYGHEARELIRRLENELDLLAGGRKLHPPCTAVLVIGKEPGSLQNLMVAGPHTFVDELWNTVGGTNVFADLPVHYSTVNLETIIQRNPRVILQFAPDRPDGIYTSEQEPEWQYLKEISAVKNRNLYTIGGDYIFIPGPRFTLLARDFAKIINQVIP